MTRETVLELAVDWAEHPAFMLRIKETVLEYALCGLDHPEYDQEDWRACIEALKSTMFRVWSGGKRPTMRKAVPKLLAFMDTALTIFALRDTAEAYFLNANRRWPVAHNLFWLRELMARLLTDENQKPLRFCEDLCRETRNLDRLAADFRVVHCT